MYNFYKTNIDNKESLKKSLFNVSRPVKKSLKESTTLITTFNLLIAMKKKYESNDVL